MNPIKTHHRFVPRAALLASLLLPSMLYADGLHWTGLGADQNWSTGNNWSNVTALTSGTAPGAADDVGFFDSGFTAPIVDAAFSGTISSLRFGSTNNDYATTIAAGTALNITGAGGLRIGTAVDTATIVNRTASFSGAASLNISNTTANVVLNQGTATAVNGSLAVLNLQNLANFNADINGLGLGTVRYPNTVAQRNAGTLYLAKTNLIVLRYAQPLSVYQTLAAATNALEMVHAGGGNNGGIRCFLYLGITNAIYVDSIGIGRSKSSATAAATMQFDPAVLGSSPVAYFRGVGGDNSRVTWWALGDMASDASSAQHAVGTNNFTGGRVDALVDTISLGRDCLPAHSASGSGRINTGVLTFDNGTIDVNTLIVGNQSLAGASSTSVTPNHGYVNIAGANATLIVNNTLKLADTSSQTHVGAQQTFGRVNVNGGTLRVNAVTIGANSTTNAIIDVSNNGKIILSNSLASASKPLRNLNLNNANFSFHLNDTSTKAFVTNLVTAGSANTIDIAASVTFPAYPAQISLFKYVNLSNDVGGAGAHNFVLGTVPGSTPGAYLSNNTANASIDLVLPIDPRPKITSLPGSYGGSPGDNVNFTAGYSGSAPITLQWLKDGTNVVDGPTGTGSTYSGATTATLAITSAQESDSGSYALVASNPYGTVTSTPPASLIISTGDIAPIINGPNNLTVIQGNDATFTTSVSGKPVPTIQWYKNGAELPGETSANLTIVNAQYPADQATYSIVASSSAGMTTNSATLTVIVTPVIAVQPVGLVVTNTQAASFTVVSTNGVPAVTYQWKKNGNNIANATNATLSFANASPADIGTYSVFIANPAGSILSSNAALTVNSTMIATSLTPSNGATSVFYDTPLTITFSVAPTLRAGGTIKIYNVTNSTTPVDTINLGLGNSQQRLFPGDAQPFTYNVVSISGNTAKIYPHFNVMTSNQTYYVTVDNGVFTDAAGAYFAGITAPSPWQFSTKTTGPADPTSLVVAADGTGDFLTVQGAVNGVPSGNTTPTMINIRNGTYTEIVNISARHNVTFRGQSRSGVLVGYANNATFQAANGGTAHARMAFKINANDIAVDTLTITNTTPQGGSQAEALMIESNARRFICNNATISSRQDTILANVNTSQGYFCNSTINGNFDYIWGGGNLFFTNCVINTLAGASGYNVTAARTDFGNSSATGNWMTPDGARWSSNGMSFVACQFTADAGVSGITLAGNNGTAGGLASWINCKFSSAYVTPVIALATTYNFWQYQNTDLTGLTPVSFANVVTLTNTDPRLLAAADASTWLNGWAPQLTPSILSNPTNQTVYAGNVATFTVSATGIPTPTYQWLHDGTNAPFATANNATLVITNAQAADAGPYSVVVSSGGGNVTSSTATLTVIIPVPPTLSAASKSGDGNFQFTASGANSQNYRVWASTNVALTPITTTWTQLSSGTFGASPVTFTDLQATNHPQRFYVLTVP